jgi:V/A-type H+-transporting ATPase subunit I
MAMDVGFGSIFTGIVAVFILVVGQALNVVLGPMSVLVHGVRLNVLEFSSHVDIKWNGFGYNPLKEK